MLQAKHFSHSQACIQCKTRPVSKLFLSAILKLVSTSLVLQNDADFFALRKCIEKSRLISAANIDIR
jgi:hypothetical protein